MLALENSVSKYPRLEGRFSQVSGVAFEYNPNKKEGSRVVQGSVLVNGESIDILLCKRNISSSYLLLRHLPIHYLALHGSLPFY
jgi:5'-nucleotidase